MAELKVKPSQTPVLRRILAAHARGAEPQLPDGDAMGRAFARALRHAAAPFAGLGLTPGAVEVAVSGDLAAALQQMPATGLTAVLEDSAGRRGLLAVAHGVVDALIEVQTTGVVEPAALPPRSVTAIDEALTRDYLDLVLSAFARETAGIEARDWPERLGYGSRVADPSQLNLLLAEGAYHVMSTSTGFAGTERQAQAVLVVPSDPALRSHLAPSGAEGAETDLHPDWQPRLSQVLQETPLVLEAVLMRIQRPLGDVQRLAVGDILPFAPADLQAVSLVDGRGRAVVTGRLGQLGGKRALRLTGQAHGHDAPDPAPPHEKPVMPPQAAPSHPEPPQAAPETAAAEPPAQVPAAMG